MKRSALAPSYLSALVLALACSRGEDSVQLESATPTGASGSTSGDRAAASAAGVAGASGATGSPAEGGGAGESAQAAAQQGEPVRPGELQLGGGLTASPDWCDRAGADEGDQVDTAIEIAVDYVDRTLADCHTAGLTAALTDDQLNDFYTYLVDYTIVLFYCPLVYNVPEGGIAVFGPANTAAAGAPPTRLGADDAALRTEAYVGAFSARHTLSSEESAQLRAYLTSVVAVDAGASASLARCEAAP
jgi:hypothetical protein